MNFYLYPLLATFEFISLPMLGWLVAASLPWLIHWWNRHQHRKTAWAAIDLLLIAVSRSSRQVKLQQWLLIAVRSAIIVLVALAVAEPVMRHWVLGSGGIGRSHTVIVLDQSYSMGLRLPDSSRLERAKAEARQLVESRRRGDVFSQLTSRWFFQRLAHLAKPRRLPTCRLLFEQREQLSKERQLKFLILIVTMSYSSPTYPAILGK